MSTPQRELHLNAFLMETGHQEAAWRLPESNPSATFDLQHWIALADASRRYGRLWRQGIPYSSLMLNSINHPDARGMKLFADALMELFP